MAFGLKSILGLLGGGALGGGAMMGLGGKGLSKFFAGYPAQEKQIQRFTPEQQGVLDQLLSQGMEKIGGTGIEDLARKRFQEDTIPSIAERFTSMGSGGGQRSSAFSSALGRSGGDLEAQLAALGQQQGMQQVGMGIQPRFDTGITPASQGALSGMGGSVMQILPMLIKLLSGGM